MKRYNLYLLNICILIVVLICTYLTLRQNLDGAKTYLFLLFFALLSACLVLFVKFFYFKNATIAWFVLVLAQLCVIIYLYYIDIIDDQMWPILFFVPAVSNFIVFFRGEGVSRFLRNMLAVAGVCTLLYTKRVLNIGCCLALAAALSVIIVGVEKLIIIIKRRYYGKI